MYKKYNIDKIITDNLYNFFADQFNISEISPENKYVFIDLIKKCMSSI